MTTRVYWAEAEQVEPAATRAYWAKLEQTNAPTRVYWAEAEATAEIGEAATGAPTIPEIAAVLLTGGASVFKGATADLTARFEDTQGEPIPNLPTSVITPESADTDVATVVMLAASDENGEAAVRATAVGSGATEITVSVDGKTSAAQIVTVEEVTSVELTVTSITTEVGTSVRATVTVKTGSGSPKAGETVTFASSNDTVIVDPDAQTTNSAGIASVSMPTLAAGTTSITATCAGFTPSGITVTVTAVTLPEYEAVGAMKVVISAETMLMRMNRARPRRFSDADQRRRDPTDSSFSRVKDNVEKELIWPNRELMKKYL